MELVMRKCKSGHVNTAIHSGGHFKKLGILQKTIPRNIYLLIFVLDNKTVFFTAQ